jgi:winged helix DNA-binding protein
MTRTLDDDQVRLLRMRSQRLAGERPTGVHALLRAVTALQAQLTPAVRLAVRARSEGLDVGAVRRACDQERSAVRTWVMRGTLHMVAAEDAGWMVALLGPALAAGGRGRRLQLGLDDELCARALPVIREVLAASGPLSRADLVLALAAKGVAIDPSGQAPAHLVAFAALHGLICRGPDLERDEPGYVLLDDWTGPQPTLEPDEALAELARHYFAAYGPAGARDLAAWAGIALGRASRACAALGGELEPVEVAGEPAWMLAAAEPDRLGASGPDRLGASGPCVRLLPNFDAYLLGYRDRELALPARFAKRVSGGGGMIAPVLVVDGRVLGTWRQRRARDRVTVELRPFEPLDRALLPGLHAEVADLGRFLGVEAALAVEGGS